MIVGIKLKDFQSHRRTHLKLSPGINVVVGPSDSGKTSIVRALRWVCLNRPVGTAIVRHGRRGAAACLTLPECQITRKRAKTANLYRIVYTPLKPKPGKRAALTPFKAVERVLERFLALPEGRPLVLRAVGRAVPEPVPDLTLLPEVCWQRQMDPPFLVSEPGPAAAARVNRAIGMDLAPIVVRRLNLIKGRADRKANACRMEMGSLEARLAPLASLDRAQRLSARQEGLAKEYARVELDAQATKAGLREAKRLRREIERMGRLADEVERAEALMGEVEDLASSIKRMDEDIEQTETLLSRYNSLRDGLASLEEQLAAVDERIKAMGRCPYCGGRLR